MKLAFKHSMAAIVLVLSFADPVAAGPLEEGREAASHGDYGTALRLLNPLAAEGNAEAQAVLGKMYETGQGVAKNDAEAAIWYRKAADQGDARAQYNLGIMYDFGQGVPQSSAEAAKWYSKAADQNHTSSPVHFRAYLRPRPRHSRTSLEAHKWFDLAGDLAEVKYRDIVAEFITPPLDRRKSLRAKLSTDVIYRKIPIPEPEPKTTLEQGITFVRNAGLQVVELRPGYVKCLMPFRNNGNHIGSMYAGALFTVANSRRRAVPVVLRHLEIFPDRQGPEHELPEAGQE